MRKRALAAVGIVLAAVVLVIGCQTSPSAPAVTIPADPSVQKGTLENGLTYYVQHNPRPNDKAELRLIVNAGSILEDDDQRGLAHFLEHMAFNGTEEYPKNELVSYLQSLGMEFGPEINAYTSFDETVYMLSVPTDKPGELEKGLDVLEQWAFHMTITEEEVQKERGVVYEEWRLGRGASKRILDQVFPVLLKGSRYPDRLPIGQPEVIQSADRARIKRFYDDWYRPDLMAIVAVGDFDADYVRKVITERFSSYQGPDQERKRTEYDVPDHDATLFKAVTDPEATNTSVEIINKYDPTPLRSEEDYRPVLAEQLYYSMFNDRMDELVDNADPPFIYGYGYSTSYTRGTALSGLVAVTPQDGIKRGMEAVLTEAARIRQHGFTAAELKRAKADLLNSYESYWKDRNNRESSRLVQPLQDNFLEGKPYPSVDWHWRMMQTILPEITLDELNAFAESLLGEANRVILVSGPEGGEIDNLNADDVLALANDISGKDLAAWVDQTVEQPLVANPPEPGAVVNEVVDEASGITTWTFSNGATLYLKPTDFKEDEIIFSGFSPGGLSLYDDQDYVSGELASTAVAVSGIGEFRANELDKALAGLNVGFSSDISELKEVVSGNATPRDFETMLQLLYLHFTGVRKDETAWGSYEQRLRDYLANQEREPRNQYSDLVNATIFNDHPRARRLKAEDLAQVDLDRALEIYRERFSHAGDFTFFLVGSFEPEAIKPMVEQWIGGLPDDGTRETWQDRGMRYFSGQKHEALMAGQEDLSIVTMAWVGDTPWSYDTLYGLTALSNALDIKLIEEVREAYGGTYSVGAYAGLDRWPVQDYRVIVQFSADPERVDELIGVVNHQVDLFRSGEIDDSYAQKVSEAQRQNYRENLERNDWWISQMDFLVENGLDWSYALEKTKWYDALTTSQLSAAANQWMDGTNYAEIILYPGE